MNPVYSAVITVCLTTFRLLRWDVRVTGVEHVPASGAGVVATNHIGFLDFVFAGYGVLQQGGRRLRFVAKQEVFDNAVSGPLMRAMGHIPVDREGRAMAVLPQVAAALRQGDLVGVFPEGTISPSFVPLDGRPGAARMAMTAGVPLVPGAVWGTQRVFTVGRRPRPAVGAVMTVDFGPPVPYDPDERPVAVHQRLMAAIRELVDRAQRTYPQRPAGAADAWWQPAHLGGSAPTHEDGERQVLAARAARRARVAADRPRRRTARRSRAARPGIAPDGRSPQQDAPDDRVPRSDGPDGRSAQEDAPDDRAPRSDGPDGRSAQEDAPDGRSPRSDAPPAGS